jgi:hypothetical protein
MRLPRPGLFRLTAVLLVAVVAVTGCAGQQPPADNSQSTESTGPQGEGQFGEVTPSPDAAPTTEPPSDEEQPEPTPTSTGGGLLFPTLVLTLPPGLLLPWPSPADCLTHNPNNVTILYTSTGPNAPLWQVVDGSQALLAYKREVDAQSGLALAKSYRKHCFVGRGTSSVERVMDYWLEPVSGAAPVPNPDCLQHDPADIYAEAVGDGSWRVRSADSLMMVFNIKEDADEAVLVLKHYNRRCYIGRGYLGSDRLKYISNWFANA